LKYGEKMPTPKIAKITGPKIFYKNLDMPRAQLLF